MARVPRIVLGGGWYHVTARGMERREISGLKRIGASVGVGRVGAERFGLHVHAFFLMENHKRIARCRALGVVLQVAFQSFRRSLSANPEWPMFTRGGGAESRNGGAADPRSAPKRKRFSML